MGYLAPGLGPEGGGRSRGRGRGDLEKFSGPTAPGPRPRSSLSDTTLPYTSKTSYVSFGASGIDAITELREETYDVLLEHDRIRLIPYRVFHNYPSSHKKNANFPHNLTQIFKDLF